MSEEYALCVTSELSNLAQIADFVSERATRAGMNADKAFEVQTAVDEACTNCMEHAYQGRADGQVHVCCYRQDDDFVVCITDHGRAFDPELVALPDTSAPLEERQVGGLGIFLMRKLMDSVEFSFCEREGNQVLMRKRITAAPARSARPNRNSMASVGNSR